MVTIQAESLEEGLVKVAQYLANEILSQSKQNLVDSGTIDTGQLLQSGDLTLTQRGAIVNYGIDYADFIEYGTDPHTPPLESLIEWCRRKLGLSAEGAKKVAFMVQRKIAKKGTDPNPYLRNAVDKVISKYSG